MDNEFPSFEKWHEQKAHHFNDYLEYLGMNLESFMSVSEEMELDINAFRRNPKIQYMLERMMWETRNKKRMAKKK